MRIVDGVSPAPTFWSWR